MKVVIPQKVGLPLLCLAAFFSGWLICDVSHKVQKYWAEQEQNVDSEIWNEILMHRYKELRSVFVAPRIQKSLLTYIWDEYYENEYKTAVKCLNALLELLDTPWIVLPFLLFFLPASVISFLIYAVYKFSDRFFAEYVCCIEFREGFGIKWVTEILLLRLRNLRSFRKIRAINEYGVMAANNR